MKLPRIANLWICKPRNCERLAQEIWGRTLLQLGPTALSLDALETSGVVVRSKCGSSPSELFIPVSPGCNMLDNRCLTFVEVGRLFAELWQGDNAKQQNGATALTTPGAWWGTQIRDLAIGESPTCPRFGRRKLTTGRPNHPQPLFH